MYRGYQRKSPGWTILRLYSWFLWFPRVAARLKKTRI